jgi:hypothetical protein
VNRGAVAAGLAARLRLARSRWRVYPVPSARCGGVFFGPLLAGNAMPPLVCKKFPYYHPIWTDFPFHGLRSRARRPWWYAPVRWKFDRSTWYVWELEQWCEVWVQNPPARYARLVRVGRVGELLFKSDTERKRLFMSVFDFLPGEDAHGGNDRLPEDEKFAKGYPALWQYLTADQYGENKPRERSSLTLRVEMGAFKLWLSEPSRSAGIEATGETFTAVLKELEARLTSAAPGWRVTGGGKRKKR